MEGRSGNEMGKVWWTLGQDTRTAGALRFKGLSLHLGERTGRSGAAGKNAPG